MECSVTEWSVLLLSGVLCYVECFVIESSVLLRVTCFVIEWSVLLLSGAFCY